MSERVEAGWNLYTRVFKREGITVAANAAEYKEVIKMTCSELLKRDSLNVIVGGVASFESANDFRRLWEEIRGKKRKDNVVFLDMRKEGLDQAGGGIAIQARLERLPLTSRSVDLFIFDFTLDFLSSDKLKVILEETKVALSEKGRGIAFVHDSLIPGVVNFYNRIKLGVPFFEKPLKTYEEILKRFFPYVQGFIPNNNNFPLKHFGVFAFGTTGNFSASLPEAA